MTKPQMKMQIMAPSTAKMMPGNVKAPTDAAEAPVPGSKVLPSQPPSKDPKIPKPIVAKIPPP